ncbi:MAG: Uma2 family endonuclease [Actinomycetota bacterium]
MRTPPDPMISPVHEDARVRIQSMQGAYTYADLAAFPNDGMRRELLDGELLVSPSPKPRHQEVSLRLTLSIGNHVAHRGGGRLFYAPLDVVLSERSVLEPDLLFILDGQIEILTEANVQGAPALVIEIVSDSRIDRVRKRDLYERFGVAEYWIVDPEADRIEILRRDKDGFGKPIIVEPGETLTTPLIPGLSIDVSTIFARL